MTSTVDSVLHAPAGTSPVAAARASTSSTVPAVAVLVLCVVWILATLVGHDPWKPDEAYSFGLVLDFLRRHDWVVPMLAGEPFLEKPPLFFITAGAFASALQDLMPLHDAARLASGFYLAVALLFLALSARSLYRGRHATTAVLLLLGCLGIVVHAHQLVTDVALFAGISIGIFGLARARGHPIGGGIALGAGTAVAFLSKGLLGPGILGVSALALLMFRDWRTASFFRSLVVAAIVALPGAVAWMTALYLRSPDLFATWLVTNNFGRFLGFAELGPQQPHFFYAYTLLWFAFPALPLALWALWDAWRDGPAGWRDDGIRLPLVLIVVTAVLLGAAHDARELYLMPILLPLVLLAMARLDRLPRAAGPALAWLGNGAFGALALVLWLAWLALITGTPALLSQALAAYQPGFVAHFDGAAFAAALLATIAWTFFVAQPARGFPRGIAQWTAGLTLCLGLVGLLYLPYLDAGKSYRGMIQSILGAVDGGGCIESRAIGEPQRALLDYFGHVKTVRQELGSGAYCDFLLVQGSRAAGAPARAPGWTPVWEGARAGDDKELYRLYVRRAAQRSGIPR
jgi:4-amino-4-deoxy-L-arabinose transferase-like glycosyltransferase